MSFRVYPKAWTRIWSGTTVPTTATMKVALLTSSYVPNLLTNDVWADISANEVSGTGYTAGGLSISGVAEVNDTFGYRLTCNTPVWTGTSVTNFQHAVIYEDDTVNKYLIAYKSNSSVLTTTSEAIMILSHKLGFLSFS